MVVDLVSSDAIQASSHSSVVVGEVGQFFRVPFENMSSNYLTFITYCIVCVYCTYRAVVRRRKNHETKQSPEARDAREEHKGKTHYYFYLLLSIHPMLHTETVDPYELSRSQLRTRLGYQDQTYKNCYVYFVTFML